MKVSKSAPPDFDKLEREMSLQISFDPGSPLRDRMIKVLERPERDPNRQKLMNKLGAEFGRIYTRYRRDVERSFGREAKYVLWDSEKPYAAQAAMWCIVKGVSPRQVLEYWHTNIKTFANRSMKFPPLSLLKSPGIIDQVACVALDPKSPSVLATPKQTDGRPVGRNSFSDVSTLDRRFRPSAERAGFDLGEFSDRYLVTLQKMAMSKAQGERVFISDKLKPLVDWAAGNLYADVVRG
jgi:hypothetical protein